MAYDEQLAERVRRATDDLAEITEKEMFGGVAFLLHGKTVCGIVKDELMVRVGPGRYEASLDQPHVREMDFTGRPMKGYVFVEPAGCRAQTAVRRWVEQAVAFVATLTRAAAASPANASPRPAPTSSGRRRGASSRGR